MERPDKECKKRIFLLASFVFSFFFASEAPAQIPTLPEGALTKWVVDGPEEIVSYLAFNPATVKERIPSILRFITIEELAVSNIGWAMEHLKENPAHSKWGISFIEIVRMKVFTIDEHSPKWPEHGAAAFWFARVAPSDPKNELGPGRLFLALDFWLPDRMYVAYMRNKGHYANYGVVRLQKKPDGKWIGSIDADGLHASSECRPGFHVERSGSSGMQVIFPPAQSGVKDLVRVAFAGHQERICEEGSSWIFKGVHPLVNGMILGPSSFQYGYDLIGGAYHPDISK